MKLAPILAVICCIAVLAFVGRINASSVRMVNAAPVQYFNAIGEIGVHWTTQTVVRLLSGTFDGPPMPKRFDDSTNKIVETVISKFTVYSFRAGTNILSATVTNTTRTVQVYSRRTAQEKWVVSK